MNLSVVIPTLNEEGNLPICLQHLNPQLTSGDEVIVVDGGSSDSTVQIANQHGCNTLIAEGSSIGMARNIGTEHATKGVIVSTDADSIPPRGWIQRIKWHFDNDPELTVLWGNIVDRNDVPIRQLVGQFSTIFRGASGNNTAFRKSTFEELKSGYPDISFAEDFVIISKLAQHGKAKRDKNLKMVMNMDRFRYQTVPIVSAGSILSVAGRMIDHPMSETLSGVGIGLAGTEMAYEKFSGTRFHHDQVGALLLGVGSKTKSRPLKGLGFGIIAHHALTEGVSAFPTTLMKHTVEVVE